MFASTRSELRRAVLSSSRDQLWRLATPALMGTALIAPIALRILAPASFGPNQLLVVSALVTASAIPYLIYLTNLRTLLAFRRTGNMLWATPVCAVVNILLNLWLVPIMGIDGSALATLLSFALLGAVTSIVSIRVCQLDRTPWRIWIGPLAATVVIFACIKVPTTPIALVGRMVGVVLCAAWIAVVLKKLARTGGVQTDTPLDDRSTPPASVASTP